LKAAFFKLEFINNLVYEIDIFEDRFYRALFIHRRVYYLEVDFDVFRVYYFACWFKKSKFNFFISYLLF